MISIVTPCYNEEDNVEDVYKAVKAVFEGLEGYTYEHIFIDNSSTDHTVLKLKDIAKSDKNVKIIVNARNFGTIRSGTYGYLQASGDAVIPIVADLQTPPSLIVEFIKKWEEGYKIVVGIRKERHESFILSGIGRLYYKIISRLSDTKLIENFMGFGLFDKKVIEIVRELDDPYPYFRGLISEIGFEASQIEYVQPARKKGISKSNFYALYDLAMLGITNHSKVPLRLATMLGFCLTVLSLLVAFVYSMYKIIFWQSFSVGIAPFVIGLFFFSAVQLFFIGIVGEYVGAIHTQVLKRPLVIEKERINF